MGNRTCCDHCQVILGIGILCIIYYPYSHVCRAYAATGNAIIPAHTHTHMHNHIYYIQIPTIYSIHFLTIINHLKYNGIWPYATHISIDFLIGLHNTYTKPIYYAVMAYTIIILWQSIGFHHTSIQLIALIEYLNMSKHLFSNVANE